MAYTPYYGSTPWTDATFDNDGRVLTASPTPFTAAVGTLWDLTLAAHDAALTANAAAVAEQARDAVGAALVAGTGMSVVPNDAADTITLSTTAVLPSMVDALDAASAFGTGKAPVMWLDGRSVNGRNTAPPADGATAAAWVDSSGHTATASGAQTNATNRPTYSSSTPGIVNSATTWLDAPNPGSVLSMYWVVKASALPTTMDLFGGSSGGVLSLRLANGGTQFQLAIDNVVSLGVVDYSPGTTDTHVVAVSYANPGAWKIRVDSVTIASGTATGTLTPGSPLRVGSSAAGSGNGWQGSIAAAVGYDVVHNDATSLRIETALRTQFGLPAVPDTAAKARSAQTLGVAPAPVTWLDGRFPLGLAPAAYVQAGTNLSQWYDVSGSGNPAIQATSSRQPTTVSAPVGVTSSSTRWADVTGVPATTVRQVYVAAKLGATGNTVSLFGGSVAGGLNLQVAADGGSVTFNVDQTAAVGTGTFSVGTSQVRIYSLSFANPGGWRLRVDGQTVASGTYSTALSTTGVLRVGNDASGASGFPGQLCALLAFTDVHDDATALRVESYLGQVFGAPLT